MPQPDLYQLASDLGKLLSNQKLTITTAESCTGGGIAYWLTSVSGSSAWFHQSFVTYSNESKQQLVGLEKEVLDAHGAVSAQTVEQMAFGALKLAKADMAISVSGIAGPDGGTDDKPVGTVWFGFATQGDVHLICQQFNGDRQSVREQAIAYALQQAKDLLTGQNLE